MTDGNDNKNTERPMSTSEVTAGTKIVRRAANQKPSRVVADICVVGSGAAGMSAAIEGARAGRKVVLVDSLPALGGQAVNSIIGTFCGLFSNGSDGYQFTHGIADDLLGDLGAQENALFYRRGPHTTVVYYDEVALGRWVEKAMLAAGVTVIVGAVMRNVRVAGRRVTGIDLSTRYGDVEVEANGFVDASGDAALVWQAGFACREPDDGPIYGTQMLIVENIDESKVPSREELPARMREKAGDYGLLRREGLSFVIPGRGVAAMNMTHVETPLEPLEASRKGIEGKDQADRAFAFLRNEFPACFGKARIRAYGFPGIRQTRWIVGRQQLSVDDVRAGTKFEDAIGRTAWPIELHDHGSGHHWHVFDKDHVHYVPFGSLAPQEADNIVAAGRCIDADKAALSSVRVMGPCMAMGAAAAHALDLAGSGSVHQIDIDALKWRVRDNLERTD
ncbi:FAD dependent oxidoreductase [Bradyrhizobium arachidis]|uniref:FAD-dependent oxidoreductase n=2 Tax=Nitrobacteraceae TaxID=41294 RepID=A0AAE7TG88_9BRAD|nr:FAD-dependent oxidoreductase [Bradyrhizobium arachidis]SFV16836.1 FAD dependent oxidoreductase [Bradyrhizobium arachidis]